MQQTIVNPSHPGVHCALCKKILEADDFFCSYCGYPRKGTEHEQRIFILKRKTIQSKLAEANKKLRQASNTLLVIGGVIVVLAAGTYLWGYLGAFKGDLGGGISRLTLGLTFIALGIWCLRRPLPATICGFALFVVFLVINLVFSPSTLFHFLILKVAIVFFLANGIRGAFDGEKLKKELNI
jgi:hypothetical protein